MGQSAVTKALNHVVLGHAVPLVDGRLPKVPIYNLNLANLGINVTPKNFFLYTWGPSPLNETQCLTLCQRPRQENLIEATLRCPNSHLTHPY